MISPENTSPNFRAGVLSVTALLCLLFLIELKIRVSAVRFPPYARQYQVGSRATIEGLRLAEVQETRI